MGMMHRMNRMNRILHPALQALSLSLALGLGGVHAAQSGTLAPPGAHAMTGTTGLPGAPGPTRPPPMIAGRAVDIADGDTFVLLEATGRRWRVRLAGIDAPEWGQPGAEASRAQLQSWLQAGRVVLEPIKTDPYGRLVARVFVLAPESADRDPDAEIGLRMVRAGHAWHFKRYRADQTLQEFARFDQAEQAAREAGIGLWSEADPQAPWHHREQRRSSAR